MKARDSVLFSRDFFARKLAGIMYFFFQRKRKSTKKNTATNCCASAPVSLPVPCGIRFDKVSLRLGHRSALTAQRGCYSLPRGRFATPKGDLSSNHSFFTLWRIIFVQLFRCRHAPRSARNNPSVAPRQLLATAPKPHVLSSSHVGTRRARSPLGSNDHLGRYSLPRGRYATFTQGSLSGDS